VSKNGENSVAYGVHHVGMTVRSLDAALAFWEPFLGVKTRWRTVLERPYIGWHVGYPGVRIAAAAVDLPGGGMLELLEYLVDEVEELPEGTANPGNVHLCLAVDDAEATWARARACGASPVRPDGPVTIDAGPNEGARASYLRIHDGITLELFQPPRGDAT
jgi:catechol 2,3-dioxygenase-like lactoylglutathione lyase family enzyme